MKILYILSGTNINGGASKSFRAMAAAVAAAGNEVAVVAPDSSGVTEWLIERGWNVRVMPYVFCALPKLAFTAKDILKFVPRLVKGAYLNIKARRTLLAFAKEFKPDIVHDNTSVTDLGHHVAKELGVPHVVHVREYGWRDFHLVLPWLRGRLTAPNAWVVAITDDLMKLRGIDLPKERKRVVYNGVVSVEEIRFDEKKEPFVLYAGRIEPNKGIADLIQAYSLYAKEIMEKGKEPLRLKIAGGCSDLIFRESLVRPLREKGLDHMVDWLGIVEVMDELYGKALLTVIPSYNEGFGRVMPEAMAAGCLCAARNSAGLSEQLANGRKLTGREIAFGFEDTDGLRGLIADVHHNFMVSTPFGQGGTYRMMIEDAQFTVRRLYSREANGKGILDFYRSILSSDLHG